MGCEILLKKPGSPMAAIIKAILARKGGRLE